MENKFGFTLLSPAEFEPWIKQQNVARTVLYIQEHHTWAPSYAHFKGNNHFELQRNMQTFHVVERRWSDIGQHFSIFPDGKIVTGRSLEISPACIFNNNSHAICIENVGNFDIDGDAMRPEQREAIIRVTAALCKRFGIPTNVNSVVYHHWFDMDTGVRTNGSGNTKTCPGTNFFGGNTVANAQANFLPLVNQVLMGGPVPPPPSKIKYYGYVTSDWLNVRNKPSADGAKINATPFGSVLRVYEEKNGWCRISATKQEWVSAKFVKPVKRGTVVNTADLNVRTGPGAQFPKTGLLLKDQEVFAFEEQDGWVKISIADFKWVSGKFVAFT